VAWKIESASASRRLVSEGVGLVVVIRGHTSSPWCYAVAIAGRLHIRRYVLVVALVVVGQSRH
jgi:hypothetical protein